MTPTTDNTGLHAKLLSIRSRARRARRLTWAIADQSVLSALTLLLTIVGARTLGASGLGVLSLGLTSFFIVLGLNRALIVDPLTVTTSAREVVERSDHDACAVTGIAVLSALTTVVFLLAAAVLPRSWGEGFLAFAPWLSFGLLVDFLRARLYRDSRQRSPALLSVVWFSTSVAAYLLVRPSSPFALAAAWGVGAAAALSLGLMLTPVRLARPSGAIVWLRDVVSSLGKWLAAESVAYAVLSFALLGVLAATIGSDGLGGIRAAQSLFTPLSLLAPALTLVALPALARLAAKDPVSAKSDASRLGFVAGLLCLAYAVAVLLASQTSLAFLGSSFVAFSGVVAPLGLVSVLGGLAMGASLWLKASSNGRALFLSHLVPQASAPLLCASLAVPLGATGAAWGLAAVALLGLVVQQMYFLRA